jgi:predicted Zn-dependent peptidase
MVQIRQERLDNGMWLVAEPIPAAQSLSMTMLVPAGVTGEPAGQQGVAAMLEELIARGAGDLDARQHSEALDMLGVQRGIGVETHHLRLTATMIGDKVDRALPLLLDMVTRPRLAEESFEPARDLCLQEIDALDDDPQERAMLELRGRHFPQPIARWPIGQRGDLERLRPGDAKLFWSQRFVPEGSILAFAGRLDWDRVREQVLRLTEPWRGGVEPVLPQADPPRRYHHVEAETNQVHIALAYDAVAETHPDSMLQRASAAVLSGGMSGRLFTEVREKRGLVYAVYASYAGAKDRGAMMGYAGTTTPRARETLAVMEAELRKLASGATPEEFDRAVVGMKSRLVMQGESTTARAGAIAEDQYMRGRPRTLEEVAAEVDAVTLERLNGFLESNPPGEMTVVTIGPEALREAAESGSAAGAV